MDGVARLRELIHRNAWRVELALDFQWVFLKAEGFVPLDFGDVRQRHLHLGKWIAEFPNPEVPERVASLLPAIHDRQVRLAKFTNPAGLRGRAARAQVCVYGFDTDTALAALVQGLGWTVRFKSNRATFEGR